jgi:hypothetical protein
MNHAVHRQEGANWDCNSDATDGIERGTDVGNERLPVAWGTQVLRLGGEER